MNNFQNQLKKGKQVEQIVKNYLENRGNKVTDYSDIQEWQNKDIDFQLEKNGKVTTLEVKTDNNLFITNNIYVESYSYTKNSKNDGVLEKCEADYICYYNPKLNKGIILKWDKLKQYLYSYCFRRNRYDAEDNKYRDYFLFPMKLAKELGLIVHSWEN